jgi:hypothetical protein
MAANFAYEVTDLNRPLREVVLGPGATSDAASLAAFGLSPELYEACALINAEVMEADAQLTPVLVHTHGFADLAHFRACYGAAMVYNAAISDSSGAETLRKYLEWIYDKAHHFHPQAPVPFPPSSGDLVRYVGGLDFAWLVSVGW